jgi:hypothetical protein
MSDEDVRSVMTTLRDSTLGPGDFKELELRLGYNHSPYNFASKPYVNAISCFLSDWMHIYLVGGLLDQELGLTMQALHRERRAPTRYATLAAYLESWLWPKALKFNVKKLFGSKAAVANVRSGHFSCSASELLSLTPVLALFFATVSVPQGYCVPLLLSLCACMDVVELLQAVKEGIVSEAVLRQAVDRHAALRREAYGEELDEAAVKAHAAQHLPDFLSDKGHGTLYACFVLERHHRLLTKYAGDRKNTESYEIGIMEDITVEMTQALDRNWLELGILHARSPQQHTLHALRELGFDDDVQQGQSIKTAHGEVHVGDAVGFRTAQSSDPPTPPRIGELVVAFRNGGEAAAVINFWLHECAGPGHTLRMRRQVDNLEIVPASAIEAAFVHTQPDDSGKVLVALPPSFR